ncbi:trypsin-like peptidase domain-containing protein [Candidatus Nomurabacteria bacterium]|nr:trypsin-like peptidase domain-containing protein [Candidatus Nomurabacteria bacterium]
MSTKSLSKADDKKTKTGNSVKIALLALATVIFILIGIILVCVGYIVAIRTSPSLRSEQSRQTIVSEGEVISDISKKSGQSVVSVITEQNRIVNSYFGQRSVIGQAAGTGVIIDADGTLLTNKHVVPEGSSSVKIVTSDGTVYEDVSVLGRDPLNDIAILKVKNPKDFIPAKLGDSDSVKTGQKVIAIGNALGQFQNTVTTGIISGVGRPIEAGDQDSGQSESLTNLFQTDAAINSGNSGGPLLNYSGEVIGINTAIAADAQNIGFAIPINETKGIIASVKRTGEVQRPFLGVKFVMVNKLIAKQLNLEADNGALISSDTDSIIEGSPAQKAGLRPGDIITKINDRALDSDHPLNTVIGSYAVGDSVKLTVLSGGETRSVTIKLDKAPNI